MATKKKMLQAAAGNATGGAGLNVEDVFSTYLYEGNGSTQTITNGIDLDGEGGLVWIKSRDEGASSYDGYNVLVDTARGVNNVINSDNANAQNWTNFGDNVTAFNSDGYSLGNRLFTNFNGDNYASWTFRKAPKFFDVVTYTGDGVAGKTISHNLGTTVGSIFVKRTSGADNWTVYHRGVDATAPEDYIMYLNTTEARANQDLFFDTAPTDSVFYLGDNIKVNGNGSTYVAYLFAHNDGDGGFGADGDADIIKCGSYTGNGSTDGPEIDLGFEPQWLLTKAASSTSDWHIWDAMRGVPTGGDDARLTPNTSEQEFQNFDAMSFLPTGFKLTVSSSRTNASGVNYIYIAIRRGTKVPESGTEVFAPNFYGTSGYVGYLGAPADMHMLGYRSGNSQNAIVSSRLVQGNKALVTSSTAAEITSNSSWDNMSGVTPVGTTLSTLISWTWKRAPGFFDAVAYTGDGSSGSYAHNLGVVPELKLIKSRSGQFWVVGGSVVTGGTATGYLVLNETDAKVVTVGEDYWGSVDSATTFSVRPNNGASNLSGTDYIAYLFASLDGVSKVGSYTGNGSSQTIDCGFTSGARFVMIKAASTTGDWQVFDTARGIVAGGDPRLELNTTAAEDQPDDIDPASSGFAVTIRDEVNKNGETFIFYAIA